MSLPGIVVRLIGNRLCVHAWGMDRRGRWRARLQPTVLKDRLDSTWFRQSCNHLFCKGPPRSYYFLFLFCSMSSLRRYEFIVVNPMFSRSLGEERVAAGFSNSLTFDYAG